MEHLNRELEHICRVKHCHFLFKHTLIDRLQVKQIVDKSEHQHNLELNQLQEVFDLLLVLLSETKTRDEFEILLYRAEGSPHLMRDCGC